MKKIALNVIVLLLQRMPIRIFDFLLWLFYQYKSSYSYRITTRIPLSKLVYSHCDFIKQSHILTREEARSYIVHLIDEERYEQVRTPDVYEVSKNNFITLRKHEIAIYCFPNARIRAKSDIIKIGINAFWEKTNRPEFAQTIPVDSDYISIDAVCRNLVSFEEKKKRKFESGFSMCGVHTNTWAHFIISYLPKLIAFDESNRSGKLSLFVPRVMLDNNKDLIQFVLNNITTRTNLEIVYIDDDEVIECANLYYCNAIGFLCDHSTYVHPASSCTSSYGAKAVHLIAAQIWPKVKNSRPRRLYIGRGAGRNLFNATEVEKYFVDQGFEIVHPHLMTLEEKIFTFGNASHICGPVSSGFANMIFCKNRIKILGFFNFARCFDPFISGLSHAGGFDHEIVFVTGHEEVNVNINNSYLIELTRIVSCCQEISYFD